MSNDFPSRHDRSTSKSEFYPSLILNDSLFELKLIDLPAIPFFPASTEVEWKEYRYIFCSKFSLFCSSYI